MEFKNFDLNYSLEGKVCAVTGAAQGIGMSIAELFSQKGATVAAIDLSADVFATVKKLGKNACGIVGDITEKEAPSRIIAEVISTFGKIDVLVNCAGIDPLGPAELFAEDQWDRTMAVNLKAPFRLSQEAAKEMIKAGQGGRIINMASQAGIVAIDGHIGYSTSKAGMIGMTKSMAFEWGKYGITVNAVSPTVTMTEMGTKTWHGEIARTALQQTPAGRFCQPVEVAGLCVYLASDASEMVTGANFVIDGGYTIH
ncbi:MAG: D-threitol dehydrogenase [Eubacteriales bacterium]